MTKTEIMQQLTAAGIEFRKKATVAELTALLVSIPRPQTKRPYRANPVVKSPGIRCRHCGHTSDFHRRTNKYPNGNWRAMCEKCHQPFIVIPDF